MYINDYDVYSHRTIKQGYNTLLLARSEERGVLVIRGIPVAVLPSCQDMKVIALLLHLGLHECS